METNKTAEEIDRRILSLEEEIDGLATERHDKMEKYLGISEEESDDYLSDITYRMAQIEALKSIKEFSTQQSKEKDERIKELEFANEEVRKKHDLARNVITDQDEEIKRLNRKKAAHQMFVGKMAGEIGGDRVIKILQECYDALNQ